MKHIERNVFSTYKVQLGSGEPIKAQASYQNQNDAHIEPLLPAGVKISGGNNVQSNTGEVEALYPSGIMSNVLMDEQIRPKLSEACRVQFPGCGEMLEVLDSEKFTYIVTDPSGRKNLFEAKYKILNSGVLDVLWHSARLIDEDYGGLEGGIAPMLDPTVK